MTSSTFAGQIAVVTGASGAIGRAIATRLLDRGATVCLAGRNQAALTAMIGELAWPADRALPYVVDLTDDDSVDRFGTNVVRDHAHVHILVHCAGTIAIDTVANAGMNDFDRHYRVNLRAPYQITQRLLPCLTVSQGQVAFVNSTSGLRASKGASQYAATKHGLRALADALRDEVNQYGVRVISMFIGRTSSRMQAWVHAKESRPYHAERLLQPDDVASMLVHALELPRSAEVTDVSMRPLLKSY